MQNYIVIVRDFDPRYEQPSDEYLCALDMYYVSPIVALDVEKDFDKALDDFEKKYRKHFLHFLHKNYELILV